MSSHAHTLAQQRWDDDRAWRADLLRQMTFARLKACHGPERAASIMAGTDHATNTDLAAWRALGTRK